MRTAPVGSAGCSQAQASSSREARPAKAGRPARRSLRYASQDTSQDVFQRARQRFLCMATRCVKVGRLDPVAPPANNRLGRAPGQSSGRAVNRLKTNLVALFAAVMLALQLPLCTCDGAGPVDSRHGAAPQPPSGHRHGHHVHGAGDAHHHHGDSGHDHSAPSPQDRSRAPDTAPCHCSPQDSPVGPLPKSADGVAAMRLGFLLCDRSVASVDCDAADPVNRPLLCFDRSRGTSPLATFAGSPCALLCRWLI